MSLGENIKIAVMKGHLPEQFTIDQLLSLPAAGPGRIQVGQRSYAEKSLRTNVHNRRIGWDGINGNHVNAGLRAEFLQHPNGRFSVI